jgi:peroxiredoxin
MTIAEQVQDFLATPSPLPTEVAAIFHREQANLKGVIPPGVIAAGEKLSDAELLDPHGTPTTLTETLDGRRAVLVFYRGAWCPYCNIALRTYQTELLGDLEQRDVALIAVSPQAPDGSLSMQEKNELRFAVLSDPGNQLAHSAGIITAPSTEALGAQRQLGLELEAVNADGTVALPMPSTLILDTDLTVRWVDVHPDYTTRTESAQIIDALDTLEG